MVSISDKNPEILRQTESQQTDGKSTVASTPNASGIFRVGLTRTEASADSKLNSLFTQYNKDGDEEISQAEFDTYTEEVTNKGKQDITSESGKRTAVGGIYTVVKGDSLSKIAKDFGIPMLDLYQANKDVIGKNINSLEIGQQINIAKVLIPAGDENSETDKTSELGNATQKQVQEMQNFMSEIAESLGITLPEGMQPKDLQGLLRKIPKETLDKFLQGVMARTIDHSKIQTELTQKQLPEQLAFIGLDWNELKEKAPDEQGQLIAQAIDRAVQNNLKEDDENSLYNRELKRLREQGANEDEKRLYKKYDFNNLSDDDKKELARLAVVQTYQSTLIESVKVKLQTGHTDGGMIVADSFIRATMMQQDAKNNMLLLMRSIGPLSEEELQQLYQTFAQHSDLSSATDTALQSFMLTDIAENADETTLHTLLENNKDYVEQLNEVFNYVATNTTDETRKSMLTNIVENSTEIANGTYNSTNTQQAVSNNNSSTPVSQPTQAVVSNPIMNTQTAYVTDLKQASLDYQTQRQSTDKMNEIPEHLRSSFSTVREYQDFKGSGMTMAQYQRAKALFRNNFTTAMNHIIKNYSMIPDKYKPKVLSYFDAMDDNTRSELYISGSDEVRQFMNKYGYMRTEKLLAYVQEHPTEMKDATISVQHMIEKLQEEETARA